MLSKKLANENNSQSYWYSVEVSCGGVRDESWRRLFPVQISCYTIIFLKINLHNLFQLILNYLTMPTFLGPEKENNILIRGVLTRVVS